MADNWSRNLGKLMPTYHYYKNLSGMEIKTKPLGFWRLVFRQIPFFVGDKIEVTLIITKQEGFNEDTFKSINLFLSLPGREPERYDTKKEFDNKDSFVRTIISNHPISCEGDIEIRLCIGDRYKNGHTIFSAAAKANEDLWLVFYGALIPFALQFLYRIYLFISNQ